MKIVLEPRLLRDDCTLSIYLLSTYYLSFYSSDRVLQMNQGIEFGLGNVQWEMAGALFGGWFLVYMIVWRGLHQSGYIIWFTALFPYTVMSVLLVRALTLEGASAGLEAYVKVSKLMEIPFFTVG